MSWSDRKAWSDRFTPQIKTLVAKHVILQEDWQEDVERCGDLVVLRAREVRVACRVRTHAMLGKYGKEFTLRSYSGGNRTEIHKIREGFGDYMFYGFSNSREDGLDDWFIGDLDVFREWLAGWEARGGCVEIKTRRNQNSPDGFVAFRRGDMPPAFIVAQAATKNAVIADMFP